MTAPTTVGFHHRRDYSQDYVPTGEIGDRNASCIDEW